jgi:hypothetical protein
MPDSSPPLFDNYDWRISQAQIDLLSDRVRKLSKKEAAVLIEFMDFLFWRRKSEKEKRDGS